MKKTKVLGLWALLFGCSFSAFAATTYQVKVPVKGIRPVVAQQPAAAIGSLSQNSLNFGNVGQGLTSSPLSVTLTNSGDASLTFNSQSTTGDFYASTNCGAGLAPNASCNINVTFTPLAGALETGTLTVSTSVGNYSVSLSGTGYDPYSAYVSALLYFDGSNGSTAFTDQKGGTYTSNNGAALTTTSPKFGTASLSLMSGYVMGPASVMAFGTQDFTVELFIKRSGSNSMEYIDTRPTNTNGAYFVLTQPGSYPQLYVNSGAKLVSSVALPNDGAWHHLAYSRQGTTGRIFVDGALGGSVTDGVNYAASNFGLGWCAYGGACGTVNQFYLDDLRVTTGVARYTAAFTPPAAALAN